MESIVMHRYDECVEWIKLKNETAEARKWLKATGRDYGVIHELSHEKSIEVVEEAYRRGAVQVEVVGRFSDDASDSSVDMLLITLPKSKKNRKLLFEMDDDIAQKTGFDSCVDEGQNYILLRWT